MNDSLREMKNNAIVIAPALFLSSIQKFTEVQREIIKKRSLIELPPNGEWSSNYQQRVEAYKGAVEALLNDGANWNEANEALSKATKDPGNIDEAGCKRALEKVDQLRASFDELQLSKGVFLPYPTDGPAIINPLFAQQIMYAVQRNIELQLKKIISVDNSQRDFDTIALEVLNEFSNVYVESLKTNPTMAINAALQRVNESHKNIIETNFVRKSIFYSF